MKRKFVKKILIYTGGAVVALFLVLMVHIVVMVKNMPHYTNPTVQLARADFKEPVDSGSAARIQQQIKKLPGVASTYFNQKAGILVYAYDNRKNNAQNIYDDVVRNSGFRSVRYTVTAEDLKSGCPVMNDNSFYGKLTNMVAKIVN